MPQGTYDIMTAKYHYGSAQDWDSMTAQERLIDTLSANNRDVRDQLDEARKALMESGRANDELEKQLVAFKTAALARAATPELEQ